MANSSVQAVPPRAAGLPRWKTLPVALRRAVQFVLLLALWQAYVTWSDVEPLIFPAPADVGRALLAGWTSGDLARATGATVWLLMLSLLIGVALGILFTMLARVSTFADDLVEPLTGMLRRSTPPQCQLIRAGNGAVCVVCEHKRR